MAKYGLEDTSKKTSRRKPSTVRYFTERRWIKNKEQRAKKKLTAEQELTIARLKEIPDGKRISIG